MAAPASSSVNNNSLGFAADLVLYLAVMFAVRELYFSSVGFLANGLFWSTTTLLVSQAAIFGFRHSYDLSERSITVGLIGLAMGIGYVAMGRNLRPLIVAHCLLNTISMADRVR